MKVKHFVWSLVMSICIVLFIQLFLREVKQEFLEFHDNCSELNGIAITNQICIHKDSILIDRRL